MNEQTYIFAASYAQRSLWFLDQLAPGNSFYNLYSGTRLTSPINEPALRRSINEVVRRHESLRTVFKAVDGEPVQVVAADVEVPLPSLDLSRLPATEREGEAQRIADAEAQKPFDLAKWPLLRASLLKLADADYILLLTIHHIVCDFWSMDLLMQELSTIYQAFCAGLPSPLPELSLQYGDYAEWEWKWLQGPAGDAHLQYWKKQLENLPALRLPTDWPRPEVSSFEGAEYSFSLHKSLYLQLVKLSQEEKTTLFMTTLAAFQVLLFRYSGQEDIVVGTPVANRKRPEVDGMVGLFANSLVLRTDLSGNPSFREVLARVREMALEAYVHQDVPFEKVVHELKPERGAGHNPLFQVHFQLLPDWRPTAAAGPLDGEFFGAEAGSAKFDLALDLWEADEGLWANVEYSTDLFNEDTIARMEGHFRTLLEAIVADPRKRISELALLTAAERDQLLLDWNGTNVDLAGHESLHGIFETQVERTPDAIALILGDEQLTYRALNSRANQLAHYLRWRGVRPETLVAVNLERSISLVVSLLAIWKAGGAYVPLEPSTPRERLQFILEDALPHLLLTERSLLGRVASDPLKCVCLDSDWNEIAASSSSNPDLPFKPQALAYIIYTSGSTGAPKGVMIESRAARNHFLWMQSALSMDETDRVLQKYPCNFDASICEILTPLLSGATLVISDPAEHWDVSHFVSLLQKHEITVLDVVPSMLEALLEEEDFVACHSLRRVISGGEALSPELAQEFLSYVDAELHNLYGPTEAAITSTSWTCLPGACEWSVPIGRPIANTQVYLLDTHLNPVPIGVPGELCIAGAGLARGYLNQLELTQSKFIPNPFSNEPGSRLYKTGDQARYLADGNIEYLGRLDQQVKLRGNRIELGEIEAVLRRHGSVQNCAVNAILDESGHKKLVAYIVPVADRPEVWPSTGEYDVYDEILYHAMTHDEVRNRSYQAAIGQAVAGKVVLDIGTGADALLARFCVKAGAKRVYAIEVGAAAFRQARELIGKLGLADRIELMHGDSHTVNLPETVDVCVSEILGAIGSSEGVISILNDAQRFLGVNGAMIPRRCLTHVAAVTLPDEPADLLVLNELPNIYTEQIFNKTGYPFDLRVCIKNFPTGNLLSESRVFEDLDFTGFVSPGSETDLKFLIAKDARLDGFLLWLQLYPGQDGSIDSLHNKVSWLPVFFPALYPGVEVSEGDVIEAKCRRTVHDGDPMPDYSIAGTVRRKRGQPIEFAYESPYRTRAFKQHPFYRSLFADREGSARPSSLSQQSSDKRNGSDSLRSDSPVEERGRGLIPTLRRFLQERLPEVMIPSSFVALSDLPLTSSGKLDRNALPAPDYTRQVDEEYVAPRGSLEQTLADIWSEVLEIGRIGVHDNFFELGGDSILSIQIIARANRAGMRLRPAQLFQHQTIAELARVAESGPAFHIEQGEVTGAAAITPIQHWFFEQNFAGPHHYNQSALIEVPSSADRIKLGMALDHLVAHHDALRLRFSAAGSGWRQTYAGSEGWPLVQIDLSSAPVAERDEAFEKAAASLQESLNISSGPVIRAALIDIGDAATSYLLLVIHHLVVDGVSWRILFEDFWTAYEELLHGDQVRLPAKTSSFQLWARRLTQYAQSAELEREAPYWLALSDTPVNPLPKDFDGENISGSSRTIIAALSVKETQALLQDIPKAFHSQINDALLTALVQTFEQWTGDRTLFIEMEGHGREAVVDDVDVSRTVGWFTSAFPVSLYVNPDLTPGEALRSIKEQLRQIPQRGIGYGLLRYLSADESLRDRFRALPKPEVAFNYLGQFGFAEAESPYWKRFAERTGPDISRRAHRPNLLEINGSVAQGRLEMAWTFSRNIHRKSTVDALAAQFTEALRSLISDCSLPTVHTFTPSDFSKARMSQKDLDRLMSKLQHL